METDLDDLVPVMDVFRLALLNRSLNRFFCSMESDGKGRQTLEKLTNFLVLYALNKLFFSSKCLAYGTVIVMEYRL